MRKKLSLLGLLLTLLWSFSAFAQEPVLYYSGMVQNGEFKQTGGVGNFDFDLNGCQIDGDAIVVNGTAPYLTGMNFPAGAGQDESGLTVFMMVSNVAVNDSLKCFFEMVGNLGFKVGTWLEQKRPLGYAVTSADGNGGKYYPADGYPEFPADNGVHVIAHSLRRPNANGGGNSSQIYVDGEIAVSTTGLHSNNDVVTLVLGGRRVLASDPIETSHVMNGMKIHKLLIYSNEVSAENVVSITANMIGDAFDAELFTDGNGTAEFDNEEGGDVIFGVEVFTQLTIVATPNEGYIFDKWVDVEDETKVISDQNPFTFRITNNVAYKAHFLAYAEKIITVSTGANGTTDKTGENKVSLTDDFTVTATANSGYKFVKWVNAENEEETVSTANPYTYTERNDISIKAIFDFGQVSAVVTPGVDDGKYYFIQSQRNSGGGPWWTLAEGDSIFAVPGEQTKEDNQKFTLISAGEGKITFKSFDGRIMTGTGAFRTDAELPEEAWTLTSSVVSGVQGFSFPGENAGLHQGASGWAWEVRAQGWYVVSDYCTFFFYDSNLETEFKALYNEALNLYNSAYVSNHPGNFESLEGKEALSAALTKATTQFGGSDEVIESGMAELQAAIDAFSAQKIKLEASTADAPIWYMIKNQFASDSRWNSVIYTTGEDVQCMWGSMSPITDQKLFRFEAHPTEENQYRIINAADPTGELNGIAYGHPEEPVYFTIKETNGAEGARFQIICSFDGSNGYNQLHAQAAGSLLVFWNNADYGSASMWQFERYYVDMKLASLIETAETIANGAVIGGSAGNHKNQADVDALKAAIAQAKTLLGSENVEEITFEEEALQAAMDEFDAASNPIETSTADEPIYYLLVNGMENGYATNKALYTVDETSVIQWESIEPLTENKFFFFEPHAMNENEYRIVNGAYPNGSIEGANYGTSTNIYFYINTIRGGEGAKFQIIDPFLDASTHRMLHAAGGGVLTLWNNTTYTGASAWKFIKLSDYMADRYEELVAEMATLIDEEGNPKGFQIGEEDGNYGVEEFEIMVDAYNAMVADYNSGGSSLHITISELTAAIAEFRASMVITDSIGNATVAAIKVAVVNGTIVAEGTDAPVQVYTIAGARKQNAGLESGVYVGRVAGKTFKVMVK